MGGHRRHDNRPPDGGLRVLEGSDREIAECTANSDDDLVQEVLAHAATRSVLEKGFVDSREFLTEEHAVVAQASASGRDDQARRAKIATRKN